MRANGSRWSVGPRTAFQVQPGDPHTSWWYPEDCISLWRFLVCEFTGAHSMVREMQAWFGAVYHWPQDSWLLRELQSYARREAEVVDISPAEGYRAVSELLSALLESAGGPSQSDGGLMERARREMQAHLDYTEGQLAELLGVSPDHLSRKWTEQTGEHLHDYLIRQRMRRACTLLRPTSPSCTEVARQVGYTSESYFARLFRDHWGMTPSRYRKERGRKDGTGNLTDRARRVQEDRC